MKNSGSLAVCCAAVVAFLLLPGAGRADDKWDLATSVACNDDVINPCNQLIHGRPQTHDLQGAAGADFDFMLIEPRANRSYEVRAYNSNVGWTGSPANPNSTKVDRLDFAGNVLTAGVAPNPPEMGGAGAWNAVRWISTSGQREYIRVRSNTFAASTANDQYEIEFLETTYFVPRWNNSGGQVTVLLVQNTTSDPVTGTVFFIGTGGGATVPLSVDAYGLQLISTGTIPALAGLSGNLQIAHLGGWGALNVKAVALEPATGFTFDTVGSQRPR